MKKLFLLSLLVSLIFVSCDKVEKYTKDGMEAYEKGKYDKAIENFTKAVEEDPEKAGVAARMLGLCYLDLDKEVGIQDDQLAFENLKIAAEAGDTLGIYWLGYVYDKGIGTLQDDEKAVSNYKKAAKMGNPEGMAKMAFLHYHGYQGVDRNEEEAVKLAKKASNMGNFDAMALLGLAYESGNGGLEKDEEKAVKLYSAAAEGGSPDGMALLGYTYMYGTNGMKENQSKGVKLVEKAVKKGSLKGLRYMGFVYEDKLDGRSGDAKMWFRKAIEAGDDYSMYLLGDRLNDENRKESQKEGVKWLEKAINAGEPKAMASLAYAYYHGRGVEKSYDKAFELYSKAAKYDDIQAWCYNNLGLCYELGNGTPKNREKAIELYKKAADKGHDLARKNLRDLGIIY